MGRSTVMTPPGIINQPWQAVTQGRAVRIMRNNVFIGAFICKDAAQVAKAVCKLPAALKLLEEWYSDGDALVESMDKLGYHTDNTHIRLANTYDVLVAAGFKRQKPEPWGTTDQLVSRASVNDGKTTYYAPRVSCHVPKSEDEYILLAREFTKGYEHENDLEVVVSCTMVDLVYGGEFRFSFDGMGYFGWRTPVDKSKQ